jgi:hypothetical protein
MRRRITMSVTLAEMELQALWYLESLERIFGDEFQGELAPKVWIGVAMLLANMGEGGGSECEVPVNLVHGLIDRGLVERAADRLCRNTAAGKATLSQVVSAAPPPRRASFLRAMPEPGGT